MNRETSLQLDDNTGSAVQIAERRNRWGQQIRLLKFNAALLDAMDCKGGRQPRINLDLALEQCRVRARPRTHKPELTATVRKADWGKGFA